MRIICDTHILIFWSQAPERLSVTAATALETGRIAGTLACSDISFWEIAMLFAGRRLVKPVSPEQFMQNLILGLKLTVLPITPEIAVVSQSGIVPHKDPADRLIAATALSHRVPLLTADERLRALPQLTCLW
jgi:PIN domain nuclease of toxin-antitoxin system